jgi:uncharacterized protein
LAEWIAKFVVRFHRWLLVAALLVGGISAAVSWKLSYSWEVSSMFAPGDPLVTSYEQLQQRLGGSEIVLAVYRDPQFWSPAGLERLESINQRLAEVEGVRATLSLSELHRILRTIRGPLDAMRFSQEERPPPLLDSDDQLAQRFVQLFDRYLHRSGSEYIAVACILETTTAVSGSNGEPPHAEIIARLREILSELPSPASNGLVAGEPVLVSDGFQLVQLDGQRLGVASSVLVSLVLLVCFRSIRWMLIPLLVVQWAVWVTQTLLVVCRFDLTMVSSTLTAIVTVVGVATSMHLLLRFQQLRRVGTPRRDALVETYRTLLVPITWACITDAIGFLALMAADVGPIRDFGLMMAIGALMVLVAIVVLVPGLALIGRFDVDPRTPRVDLMIRLWLRRLLDGCLANRKWGLIALLVIFAVALLGSRRLRVETDFTKNFDPESPLVQSYRVIESELGGAGVWDVMLPAPGVVSEDYLQAIRELEERLRDVHIKTEDGESTQLTKVLSIADADAAATSNPLLGALPLGVRLQGMRKAMPEFSDTLLTPAPDAEGRRWLRIMLRSEERAAASSKRQLIARVQAIVQEFTSRPEWRELFSDKPPAASVTGYHVMLSRMVDSILADQWKCFLLATLGIFVALIVATRSIGLALAALVPNAIPILVVLGLMGWGGTPINMGAAMIAAVSMGLSIDSSIHYLLHYRRMLETPMPKLKALRSAQENVGLAAVLATIALIAGFLTLTASDFEPTVVFGTLASLTMLGGLVGNLLVLPMIVAPWTPR